MDYVDQDKTCQECTRSFSFSAGEQKFFAERNFTPPSRCKACRDKRKASQPREQRDDRPRQDTRSEPWDQEYKKFDRYAKRKRRRRHEREEDDDWW